MAKTRFRRPKDVGAHFGLTPRKYQSGETDRTGRIRANSRFHDVRAPYGRHGGRPHGRETTLAYIIPHIQQT